MQINEQKNTIGWGHVKRLPSSAAPFYSLGTKLHHKILTLIKSPDLKKLNVFLLEQSYMFLSTQTCTQQRRAMSSGAEPSQVFDTFTPIPTPQNCSHHCHWSSAIPCPQHWNRRGIPGAVVCLDYSKSSCFWHTNTGFECPLTHFKYISHPAITGSPWENLHKSAER